MFRPFTIENAYVFRSDNVRSLFDRISEDERSLLTWNPEKFDWYDYWLNIHLPGLTKWVFPTLEDEMRAQPKRVYTYRDLLELFETSTKRHATRVAMRIERDGRKEQYTYADLRELATRVAGFLASQGIKPGDRVMLVSSNCARVGHELISACSKRARPVFPCDPESSTERDSQLRARGKRCRHHRQRSSSDQDHADLREQLQRARH